MDIPSVRSQLRREAVNNDTSTHGNLIIDGAMSNAQNHNNIMDSRVPEVRFTHSSFEYKFYVDK